MENTLEQIWEYAQSIANDNEDDPDPDSPSLKEISPEKIEKTVDKIEQKIKNILRLLPKLRQNCAILKTSILPILKDIKSKKRF